MRSSIPADGKSRPELFTQHSSLSAQVYSDLHLDWFENGFKNFKYKDDEEDKWSYGRDESKQGDPLANYFLKGVEPMHRSLAASLALQRLHAPLRKAEAIAASYKRIRIARDSGLYQIGFP